MAATDASKTALFALRMMLAPIVRFCLRRGLHLQDLVDAGKKEFIGAARAEMPGDPNISRLSAATGLQRRDVTRLLSAEENEAQPLGLTNRIIGQWIHDRR